MSDTGRQTNDERSGNIDEVLCNTCVRAKEVFPEHVGADDLGLERRDG